LNGINNILLDLLHCHHEKTWLIDVGHENEIIFTGGMTLAAYMENPGHTAIHTHKHDIYMELQGPSATDVHHSFVQRWNEALNHKDPFGCYPSYEKAPSILPFSVQLTL
jgi:phosphatidylserine/phosphatidylglycerophosphate/cardiolipin synthase-like enzyme